MYVFSLESAFQRPNYAILCLQITCQSRDVFDDVCLFSFIKDVLFLSIMQIGQLLTMLKIDKISKYKTYKRILSRFSLPFSHSHHDVQASNIHTFHQHCIRWFRKRQLSWYNAWCLWLRRKRSFWNSERY